MILDKGKEQIKKLTKNRESIPNIPYFCTHKIKTQ